MNKKSIKLNSANIITIRKNIDITINKYWRIIRAENLMSKKAIAAKQGSGLDLKSLYNQIVQLSEKRIMIKGILVALNTGTTTFSYEDFKKTNNYSIFATKDCFLTIHSTHFLQIKQKSVTIWRSTFLPLW